MSELSAYIWCRNARKYARIYARKYNPMYLLSQKALQAIDEARPHRIINHLASALILSESRVNRIIRENEPNGDLTKRAALEVIQKDTKLKLKDILQCADVSAAV
jgi:hypothetical protein